MKGGSVLLAVLVVGAVLWVPADAWAGPLPSPVATDPSSLLRLLKQMRSAVDVWERGGQDAARVAFLALGALNLAWLGNELLLQGGDIRSGLGRLARELVVMSMLYALIEIGPRLAREVVSFLRRSADGIAGSAAEDQVWNALQDIVKACTGLLRSGEVGILEVLWLGLCVVAVIICVGLTGAIMLVTEAATELIIGLGAIVLGGGGAIWTRFLVQNYLKFSFSAGLALYVMRFVQSFVIGNLAVWANEASASDAGPWDIALGVTKAFVAPKAGNPELIFTMLLTVVIQLILVIAMPALAVMLTSGGVGRLSEWAGLGAAQQLAGMGAQGLKRMGAALSSSGAARGAAGVGAGQDRSVLGATGGAVPPPTGGGRSGASARGADLGVEAFGGASSRSAPAASAERAVGDSSGASGAGAGSDGQDEAKARSEGGASASERSGSTRAASTTERGGKGKAGEALSGEAGQRGHARSAWSGQGTQHPGAKSGGEAARRGAAASGSGAAPRTNPSAGAADRVERGASGDARGAAASGGGAAARANPSAGAADRVERGASGDARGAAAAGQSLPSAQLSGATPAGRTALGASGAAAGSVAGSSSPGSGSRKASVGVAADAGAGGARAVASSAPSGGSSATAVAGSPRSMGVAAAPGLLPVSGHANPAPSAPVAAPAMGGRVARGGPQTPGGTGVERRAAGGSARGASGKRGEHG